MRGLMVFIVWSLVEISLFVTVGSWIGLLGTLLVILGSGVAGMMILRGQGSRLRQMVRGNGAGLLAQSGLNALAAVLLILPGFLTDMLGAVLLVPWLQRQIIARVGSRFRATVVQPRPYGEILEAVAVEADPEPKHERSGQPSGQPSGWTKP